jgi:hypothetical protein
MNQTLSMLFILCAGVFTVLGAVMDWDFFMNNRRAKLFVSLFGRQGARVVYVILGVFLVGVGTVKLLG